PGLDGPLTAPRQLAVECALVGPERPAGNTEPARAEPLAEVRDRAGPERDVDLRVQLEQPLALGLRVAAADRDNRLRVRALVCDCVAEMGRGLRVRLLPDRAGV